MRNDIELVSTRLYSTAVHSVTATQHSEHNEFSLSLPPISAVLFFADHISGPFNWVLIMSAVVNSIFSPQDQG